MLIGIFYSQIVESSSVVSVLFREAISHPYISFFHLLVNGFSVTSLVMLDFDANKVSGKYFQSVLFLLPSLNIYNFVPKNISYFL